MDGSGSMVGKENRKGRLKLDAVAEVNFAIWGRLFIHLHPDMNE